MHEFEIMIDFKRKKRFFGVRCTYIIYIEHNQDTDKVQKNVLRTIIGAQYTCVLEITSR